MSEKEVSNTTETLRDRLFDSIDAVIEGRMEPKQAQAVANLADKICKTAQLEVKYLELMEEGIIPAEHTIGNMRLGSGAKQIEHKRQEQGSSDFGSEELSEQVKADIVEYYEDGASLEHLAATFRTSESVIDAIVKKAKRKRGK